MALLVDTCINTYIHIHIYIIMHLLFIIIMV